MASSLVIRAPFLPVSSSDASAYKITENFEKSERTTVEVKGTAPPVLQPALSPLTLQPVFLPCTLTFKPHTPQTIPADPSQHGATAVEGDLFLELSDPKGLGNVAPTYKYPFLFAYLGVTLTSAFFQGTVLAGNVMDPLNKLGSKSSSLVPSIVASAFAAGEISVTLKPTKSDPAYAFPTIEADPSTFLGSVKLASAYAPSTIPSVRGGCLPFPALRSTRFWQPPTSYLSPFTCSTACCANSPLGRASPPTRRTRTTRFTRPWMRLKTPRRRAGGGGCDCSSRATVRTHRSL